MKNSIKALLVAATCMTALPVYAVTPTLETTYRSSDGSECRVRVSEKSWTESSINVDDASTGSSASSSVRLEVKLIHVLGKRGDQELSRCDALIAQDEALREQDIIQKKLENDSLRMQLEEMKMQMEQQRKAMEAQNVEAEPVDTSGDNW